MQTSPVIPIFLSDVGFNSWNGLLTIRSMGPSIRPKNDYQSGALSPASRDHIFRIVNVLSFAWVARVPRAAILHSSKNLTQFWGKFHTILQ